MRRFAFSALLIAFHGFISLLTAFQLIALFIAFSKEILQNHFFKRSMFRTNRFVTKHFFDTKLATENISVCCFFCNPGLTPSSTRLNNSEKLIITPSFTKDVYIRPCISLIRHQRQIYTS